MDLFGDMKNKDGNSQKDMPQIQAGRPATEDAHFVTIRELLRKEAGTSLSVNICAQKLPPV